MGRPDSDSKIMTNFALLWAKILDSSLWIKESKETRLVWITLLAMRDWSSGIVQSSVIGLADRAKVSVAECRAALDVLKSPDADDTSTVENGIRIREVPGGWQIVNHDKYRFSTEAKRALWAQQKAEQRANKARLEEEGKAFEKGFDSEVNKRLKHGVARAHNAGRKAGGKHAVNVAFPVSKHNAQSEPPKEANEHG